MNVHIKIFKLHFINVLIPYGYNGIMHFHVIIIDSSIITRTPPAHTDPDVSRYQVKSKETPMFFFFRVLISQQILYCDVLLQLHSFSGTFCPLKAANKKPHDHFRTMQMTFPGFNNELC